MWNSVQLCSSCDCWYMRVVCLSDMNNSMYYHSASSGGDRLSNTSIGSHRSENSFLVREQQLKWRRSAAMNLKSFYIQSTLAALSFLEFYLCPSQLFLHWREARSLFVWCIGLLFSASSLMCLLCYLIFRNKPLFAAKQDKPTSGSFFSARSPVEKLNLSLTCSERKNDPLSTSFSCVRLTTSQNSSQLSFLNNSQNSASPLHNMSTSSLSNTSPSGRMNQSYANAGSVPNQSVSRSPLSPNESLNMTNSSFRAQSRNTSSSTRQRNSLIAAAEQVMK